MHTQGFVAAAAHTQLAWWRNHGIGGWRNATAGGQLVTQQTESIQNGRRCRQVWFMGAGSVVTLACQPKPPQ